TTATLWIIRGNNLWTTCARRRFRRKSAPPPAKLSHPRGILGVAPLPPVAVRRTEVPHVAPSPSRTGRRPRGRPPRRRRRTARRSDGCRGRGRPDPRGRTVAEPAAVDPARGHPRPGRGGGRLHRVPLSRRPRRRGG